MKTTMVVEVEIPEGLTKEDLSVAAHKRFGLTHDAYSKESLLAFMVSRAIMDKLEEAGIEPEVAYSVTSDLAEYLRQERIRGKMLRSDKSRAAKNAIKRIERLTGASLEAKVSL